ncbi:1791_t:CDS:2 [Acaulospora colombiana]|uniref:1791_t:CDS:1 n=1 Tax=Acaulospora colombiana TaxID=27376 RepID=A0ACA9M0X6_9GLOM|nr:1791_t:CDS:2 [Acaulospora colombiana]
MEKIDLIVRCITQMQHAIVVNIRDLISCPEKDIASILLILDNHILDVIEVEGDYIEKYTLTTVPLNVGQRYSVIVKADQEISNYWMRSAFDYTVHFVKPKTTRTYNNAIVHYEGADEKEPTTQFWNDSVMSEWKDLDQLVNLKPYYYEALPPSDLTIMLTAQYHMTEGYINGSMYVPDDNVSTLHKVYRGVQEFDANQNVFTFTQPGQVIDIIVYNLNSQEHPFHMVDSEDMDFNPRMTVQIVELPDSISKLVPPQDWVDLCSNSVDQI